MSSIALTSEVGRHIARVYGLVAATLAVTGIVGAATGPALSPIMDAYPALIVAFFAASFMPIVFMSRLSKSAPLAMLGLFAITQGPMVGVLVHGLGTGLVLQAMEITAGSVLGLGVYGAVTKRDLSGWRGVLEAGLIGLIIAMLASVFIQSTALHFAVSGVAVILFCGFIAHDTADIKTSYDPDNISRSAVLSAVNLYLDILNLFVNLLEILRIIR
jgi:FtsH-binding integral membrane protein